MFLPQVTTLLVSNLLRNNKNKATDIKNESVEVKKNETVIIKEGTKEKKETVQENDTMKKTENETLEEKEINQVMESLISAFKKEFNAELRS